MGGHVSFNCTDVHLHSHEALETSSCPVTELHPREHYARHSSERGQPAGSGVDFRVCSNNTGKYGFYAIAVAAVAPTGVVRVQNGVTVVYSIRGDDTSCAWVWRCVIDLPCVDATNKTHTHPTPVLPFICVGARISYCRGRPLHAVRQGTFEGRGPIQLGSGGCCCGYRGAARRTGYCVHSKLDERTGSTATRLQWDYWWNCSRI